MTHVKLLLALPFLAVASSGCWAQTSDAVPSGAEEAFAEYDRTGGGWLSGTELDACACAHYDADGDGEVTEAEFYEGYSSEGGSAGGPPRERSGSTGSAPVEGPPVGAPYPAGGPVEIAWHGSWYAGRILEADGGRYKVRYDGYSESWDEWVGPDRLRPAEPAARGEGGDARPAPDLAVGGPRAGRYYILSYGDVTNPIRLGYIDLRADGTYAVLDAGRNEIGSGRYAFDAGAGGVRWLSGRYREDYGESAFEVDRGGATHKLRLNRVTVAFNDAD